MIFHCPGSIFSMSNVKEAVLLAGGSGSRLQPFTFYTSKHLLPIDNVPMIFYPLKNLQLIGINKVFLIINREHLNQWNCLLSNYNFEMEIIPIIQDRPLGIPAAIECCSEMISGKSFLVALGDNIIIASNFLNIFKSHLLDESSATICGFNVSDPRAFGVAQLNSNGSLVKVVEKPKDPPSSLAIAGFYQFPASCFQIIKNLEYSDRGELEVADLINYYISNSLCDFVKPASASDYWIDTGSNASLVHATNFIRDLKKNSGISIAEFEQLDLD